MSKSQQLDNLRTHKMGNDFTVPAIKKKKDAEILALEEDKIRQLEPAAKLEVIIRKAAIMARKSISI